MTIKPGPHRGPHNAFLTSERPKATPEAGEPGSEFTKEQVDAVLNALAPFWTRAIGPEGKSLVTE